MLDTADIFEFEEFRLDRWGDGLCRRDENGTFVSLSIGSRALDVLSVLVGRAGELVTKEEVMAAVWRRSVVENANLTVQIAALRRVLDQGRTEGSCIQTVAVRGYRFLPAVTRVEQTDPSPVIAPRLSIVVLPFTDLSEDRRQQYFADGMTDDLTTDLARLQNVLVISRNTAFTYKDQQVDAKQIGRELGVRYVLEGSVRRSVNQVRVNAQLVDAAANTHLWAERFDQDIGDLFALQNEITSRIANTLGWELISAETARTTDRPDALDYLLRGRAVRGTGNVRENVEKAIDLFERALALDPNSVEAQSQLAIALLNRSAHKDPAAAAVDVKHAEELIAGALATSPREPFTHRVKGFLLRLTRRCEEAIPEFEIALAANRNDPHTLVQLSVCKYLTGGSDKEAIALIGQAIRLSPRDPSMGGWYTWLGFVHLLQSRVDEAIASLEKARSLDPKAWNTRHFLAAAYGSKGDLERARGELAEAKRLVGSDRYSSVARTRANNDLYTPALRDRWETVIFPGMRARRNAGGMSRGDIASAAKQSRR